VDTYTFRAMCAATTTVRVSPETVRELERFRGPLHTRTADETIRALMRLRSREMLRLTRGLDRGRLTDFREEDRGEDPR
jgi:hypothetical protein